jgi:hypothetical protein
MRLFFTLDLRSLRLGRPCLQPSKNALVKKDCAVYHTDGPKNGGLSLEHYDAAKRDPGLAAMILSKLNNSAMGAAGNGGGDGARSAAQEARFDRCPCLRVLIVLNPSTEFGEMQLTLVARTAGGAQDGASVGGKALGYRIERKEPMGNRGTVQTGHRSVVLSSGKGRKLALPKQSLIVRDLFPGETVGFPCERLDKESLFPIEQVLLRAGSR